MATQLNPRPLTTNEQAASGYTHEVTIECIKDLTDTVADEDMTFNLFKTQAGDVIEKAALHIIVPFEDASDAAFNDTKVSFGDEDDDNRFIANVQCNRNGTEVYDTFENTAYGPYTGVKQITALVEAMTAKKLSDLDLGKVVILFKLNRAAKELEAGAA